MGERRADETCRRDVRHDFFPAEAKTGVDESGRGSPIEQIAVAVKLVAQAELLAAREIDMIADSQKLHLRHQVHQHLDNFEDPAAWRAQESNAPLAKPCLH